MPTLSRVTVTREASIDAQGARVYLWKYFVESDSIDTLETEVGAILPTWGSVHPTDSAARCTRVSAQQTANLYHWECEAEWTTQALAPDKGTRSAISGKTGGTAPSSPGGNTPATAPNLRPWVWTWTGKTRTEHVFQDRTWPTPKAVVNAAGQPFDTGLEVPRANACLHITCFKLYEIVSPGEKIRLFLDAVNSRPWMGYEAQEARCTEYKESTVYEQGAWFWQIDVTIEFQVGGWQPVKILNAGTMYRRSTVDPLQPILDRHGNPVTQPVPLKADGSGALEATGTPNYIEFNPYEQADFKLLI